MIKFYQVCVSAVLPLSCRFYPSCSHYMQAAIQKFGVIKGVILGLRRLSKCHPWHPGGVDLIDIDLLDVVQEQNISQNISKQKAKHKNGKK